MTNSGSTVSGESALELVPLALVAAADESPELFESVICSLLMVGAIASASDMMFSNETAEKSQLKMGRDLASAADVASAAAACSPEMCKICLEILFVGLSNFG